MQYKHQHFQLNTDSKKVFDKNNKELRLTGNAFRVLEFLCKNRNANLTEIGDHLDHAKDYDENHIRQYRYKINTIIGEDVIEYKNGIYSLAGDCNTDLLQSNNIEFFPVKKTKLSWLPGILAIIILILSFLSWQYEYYIFLRWLVTGTALYYTYLLYTLQKQNFWFWGLIAITVLFNPIIPVHLYSKAIWNVIDVVVAIFFVSLLIKLNKYE